MCHHSARAAGSGGTDGTRPRRLKYKAVHSTVATRDANSMIALIHLALVACVQANIYVSVTDGNDGNDGTSAATPVRTLGRARTAARMSGASTVLVGSGKYELSEPLVLGPEDSGVHWQGEQPHGIRGGDSVRISGGVELVGWSPSPLGPGIVQADVSSVRAAQSRHLFVGGVRARRTRYPVADADALFTCARMTDDGFELHAGTSQVQCAADFGTTTPCCGQGGGEVSPEYQCPVSAPTCDGYVENVRWGTCQCPPPSPSPPAASPPWPHGGEGVEFVYPESTSPWTEPRCAVASRNATHVMMKQPCWRNLVHKACDQGAHGPPLVGRERLEHRGQRTAQAREKLVQNGYVVAGLGAPLTGRGYIENVGPSRHMVPGDWALDGGMAYYALRANESAATLEAVMPLLTVLVNVSGARDLTFSGLTFEHATWRRPGEAEGYVEQQSGCATLGTNWSANTDCLHDFFWSFKAAGNVLVEDSTNVSFVACEFARLGGFGLDLTRARACVVEGCFFHDISGSAIQLGQFQDALASELDRDNVLRNNIITRAAVEYSGAVGINVGYTVGTLIEHNDVSDLTYGAISVGWGWSRHACATCTNAANNTIRFNRLYEYKQTLDDGGGIYMLGPQNGSQIHGNYVHDQGTASSGALYPDEGSAYSSWYENVVTDIGASEWLHLWTSSIHDVVVRSNWADTTTFRNDGTNCPMIDNRVFPPGQPPPEAQAIMDFAGVPSSHRWVHTLKGKKRAVSGISPRQAR